MAEDNYLQHTALLLLFICLISSIFLISVSVLEFCRILVTIVGCRLSRTCKIWVRTPRERKRILKIKGCRWGRKNRLSRTHPQLIYVQLCSCLLFLHASPFTCFLLWAGLKGDIRSVQQEVLPRGLSVWLEAKRTVNLAWELVLRQASASFQTNTFWLQRSKFTCTASLKWSCNILPGKHLQQTLGRRIYVLWT